MTIDEAIKIKEKYQYLIPKESYPQVIIADNLSIEALKRLELSHGLWGKGGFQLLPGETEK